MRQDFHTLDKIVREQCEEGSVVIVDYLEKLFPPHANELDREFLLEMILRWAISADVLNSSNQVILTTSVVDAIHQDLRNSFNKVDLIEIPRPNEKDRLKFLLALYASQQYNLPHRGRKLEYRVSVKFGEGFPSNSTTDALKTLANKSSGLNRMGLEDLFLRSQAESKGEISLDYVTRHKKALLASESAGLLEVIEPRLGFDEVGGLKLIRERLEFTCKALGSTNRHLRQTVPMGILFLGPPGTGKTLVAEALAKESHHNFVKLGNIREMWVGQSERNLSMVLSLVKSMKPVVVFIDEIDQSEGRRSEGGDSGVSGRIFSRLLEFMSDTSLRGDILWIGASNQPDLIDKAMKRAGRFDLKLPFFLPEKEDRKDIFAKLLKAKDVPHTLKSADFDALASGTHLFSGAEIEVVISEAYRIAVGRNSDEPEVTMDDFRQVLDTYSLGVSGKEIETLEKEILKDVPFEEYWPERYRDDNDKQN